MLNFVRGADIGFTISNVRDMFGTPTTPAALSVRVYFHILRRPQNATVNLVNSGGVWTGIWSSTDADPGLVEWHAYTVGTAMTGMAEGSFLLTANDANMPL